MYVLFYLLFSGFSISTPSILVITFSETFCFLLRVNGKILKSEKWLDVKNNFRWTHYTFHTYSSCSQDSLLHHALHINSLGIDHLEFPTVPYWKIELSFLHKRKKNKILQTFLKSSLKQKFSLGIPKEKSISHADRQFHLLS